MANTQKGVEGLSNEQLAAILQTLQGTANPRVNDVLDIIGEDLAESRANRKEEQRIQKEARRQGALAMQQKHERDMARQANCAHMKPNRESAVAAQRDHSNNYHWICQYCFKQWLNDELPAMLRIDAVKIGGPVL